eukprot:3031283-Rhodomonas_salina.1
MSRTVRSEIPYLAAICRLEAKRAEWSVERGEKRGGRERGFCRYSRSVAGVVKQVWLWDRNS